jgi:hypothetical protein
MLPRNPILVNPAAQVTITSHITDNRAVASGTLYYSVNGGSYTAVNMSMSSGSSSNGMWTASIPAQTNGSVIRYYARAKDLYNNSSDTIPTLSQYLVVTGGLNIAQLQYSIASDGRSIWENDTLNGVSISGIVTATAKTNDLGLVTIQNGSAPNAAIFVQASAGSGIENWNRGDSVVISSFVVKENAGLTTLYNAGGSNHTLAATAKALPPFITNMNIDSIRLGVQAYTEPYEGMLMQFDSVYVVNLNPDAPSNFGEFSFRKDTSVTTGLRADDQSNDIPANFNTDSLSLKRLLPFIKGVLSYSNGNWKLLPRDRADISFKVSTGTYTAGIRGKVDFSIYPNPANELLTIEAGASGSYGMILTDVTGRTIRSADFFNNPGGLKKTIDISSLKPGIYFLSLTHNGATGASRIAITR